MTLVPVVSITPFEPGDGVAFADLNRAWLVGYGLIEPADERQLQDPQTHVFGVGGGGRSRGAGARDRPEAGARRSALRARASVLDGHVDIQLEAHRGVASLRVAGLRLSARPSRRALRDGRHLHGARPRRLGHSARRATSGSTRNPPADRIVLTPPRAVIHCSADRGTPRGPRSSPLVLPSTHTVRGEGI